MQNLLASPIFCLFEIAWNRSVLLRLCVCTEEELLHALSMCWCFVVCSSAIVAPVFLFPQHAISQAGEDPFGDQRKDKKARIASQEGRQLKNKQASDKIHGKPVLPPTLKLAASLPEHGKGAPTKRRELKLDVRPPDCIANVLHAASLHVSLITCTGNVLLGPCMLNMNAQHMTDFM